MSKKKILIVDDMVQLTKAVSFSLKAEGYDVIMAYNGKEALERIKEEKPDLIVLDILMPGMDGYEVCQELKKNEETKSIPIILFTSKAQKKDVVSGIKVGADDYIVKPYKFQVLHEKIQRFIGPGIKEGKQTKEGVKEEEKQESKEATQEESKEGAKEDSKQEVKEAEKEESKEGKDDSPLEEEKGQTDTSKEEKKEEVKSSA